MLKKPGVNMPNLQHSTAPGVGPNLSAMLAETQPGGEESKEDPDGGLTESSICNWKASKKKHLRSWTCRNTVIRNPAHRSPTDCVRLARQEVSDGAYWQYEHCHRYPE